MYWYNQQGNRYFIPKELAEQERLKAEQERLRVENVEKELETLFAKLKASGVDTDAL